MATSTTPTTTSATTVAVKLVTPDGTIRRVVVARGVGVAELKHVGAWRVDDKTVRSVLA